MKKIAVLSYFLIFVAAVQTGTFQRNRKNSLRKIFHNGRIVGGEDTDITEIPYQVQLEDGGVQICGGSIISAYYVLTAAHCTYGTFAWHMEIRYGTNTHNDGGDTVKIAEISENPDFSFASLDYDVSVLLLETPIIISDNAQPIALASVEPKPGAYAIVSGWGATTHGSSQSDQLQSVTIPIVEREQCIEAYNSKVISTRMLCAGISGRDSCLGDAGGPLVSGGLLSGIVSWMNGCAEESYPGIYSNIAALRDFIDAHSGNTARWV